MFSGVHVYKENVKPLNFKAEGFGEASSGMSLKEVEPDLKNTCFSGFEENKLFILKGAQGDLQEKVSTAEKIESDVSSRLLLNCCMRNEEDLGVVFECGNNFEREN